MIRWVIKRDRRKRKFKRENIEEAIKAAFLAVDGVITPYAIEKAESISNYIANLDVDKITVEEVQDLIEKGLMSCKRKDVAKAYIEYRIERSNLRANTTDAVLKELVNGESDYWNNENSNKNSRIVSVQRDYIAGIASTDAARRWIFPKELIKLHDKGLIHIHDMDYALQNSLHNCDLINLEDMLENGTCINGVSIDPQRRLSTAVTVATQIITAVASSQYGGCSVNLHDLAPYVKMSYNEYYNKYLEYGLDKDKAELFASKDLKKCIADAVQTFNYQINSMSTTNGQAPFLSLFIYLRGNEYEKETAMLAEEFFKQRIKGFKNRFGNWVTQAFPKILYVLDDNNITKDSEYYWLTKLAVECTSKRMVPDYISAKIMKELKGDVYSVMGCRSALTPDRWSEKLGNISKAKNFEKHKGHVFSGRFNTGVVSINLPYVAFLAKSEKRDFFEVLDETCEYCRQALRVRIDRLDKTKASCAPILWQDGALARLDADETLHDLIYNGYSTASLGYVGLWETTLGYTGNKLTNDEGKSFALKVLQFLNDKCNEWRHQIIDESKAEKITLKADDEVEIDD